MKLIIECSCCGKEVTINVQGSESMREMTEKAIFCHCKIRKIKEARK